MKKTKIILSLLVLFAVLLLPIIIAAQIIEEGELEGELPQPPSEAITSLPNLINKIETLIWAVFSLVAIICFVIAGILFLTAAGNPDKVAQARNAFIWGVVGIVVGVLAYSILTIVEVFFTGS